MKPLPPIPAVDSYDRTVTARRLLVSYLLVAAIPVALWAASQPTAAAVLAAGVAGTVATIRRLRLLRRDSVQKRHVCLPRTSVCVEV